MINALSWLRCTAEGREAKRGCSFRGRIAKAPGGDLGKEVSSTTEAGSYGVCLDPDSAH